MPEFEPTTQGVRIVLDDTETLILRQLCGELRAVFGGGRIDRGDPVYDRLFPSAYEDAKDEAAYRDLIGDSLVQEKLEGLDAISTALGTQTTDVTLDDEALQRWLGALTDLRLAIGMRLDVDEERMSQEVGPDDPDAQALSVLHWLGWVQEGLIRATEPV
jgi:uncharacterized protein DUF2017